MMSHCALVLVSLLSHRVPRFCPAGIVFVRGFRNPSATKSSNLGAGLVMGDIESFTLYRSRIPSNRL